MSTKGNRVEKLKDLILTSEQYRDHPFAHAEEQRAYVFELANGAKKLVFFGSAHINDPQDPLFEAIRRKFQETNPDIVYVEGMESVNTQKETMRKEVQKTTFDKTKTEGESHYTLKLGIDAGTDFESPEPEFSQEILYLLDKGFSKKGIFTFYIYRDVDQYIRQSKVRSLEGCKKYLKPYLKSFRKASRWDRRELNRLEQEVFAELNVENDAFYKAQVDPIPWRGKPQTVINEIARVSSNFRDRHIFARIAEGLKRHDRLFIVYGSAHAVMLEPALKGLMEKVF